MSVPIRHTISTPARIAAIVAVVLALVLLAWIGGEIHYRNCLSKVQLTYAAPRESSVTNGSFYVSNAQGGTVTVDPQKHRREQAVSNCSRLAF